MSRPLGRYGLVVHGGAGALPRARMTAALERRIRSGLLEALEAGIAVLREGGAALDAVCAAVVVLEDSPLFNAGRGAVLNAAGGHELDAAVMDGAQRAAGGVAAVRHVRNPVLAARAVMERSPHVLLCGAAADRHARSAGLAPVPQSYYTTAMRRAALAEERQRLREGGAAELAPESQKHGTVGAVALDAAGNLAAATSTGGRTNKMAGRIGDSPVPGAGVYADNGTCAVSGTGDGDVFLRAVAAHQVAARMQYSGSSADDAARVTLADVARLGGTGGLIVIDRSGRIAMPFNTEGMYRGCAGERASARTGIYRDRGDPR